jgi:nitroimidazol reductase NimA-like FMN-containing flavoprotein (pyridoxamine 5'-phosphate oxidase superfamily)
MPKLTTAERDAFLEETGFIMNIGTVDGDGLPLVTPIWFVFEEGKFWFTPRQHSEWLKHIRDNGKAAFSIDEQVMPYRKVVVRGPVEVVFEVGNDDKWRDRYRRIAQRYVPQDDANAYVDGTDDQPRALCAMSVAECNLRTWRMPVADEAYDGIWAKRYWTDDAKIKAQSPDVIDKSV